MFSSMWQKWLNRRPQPSGRRLTAQWRFRPRLVMLEDRMAPAVLVVNTLADAGDQVHLDLREAISAVNSGSTAELSAQQQQQISGKLGAHDKIRFAPGLNGILTLEQGELDITNPVVIRGPSQSDLTIDAHQQSRIFMVGADIQVTLEHLSLANGQTMGNNPGAGILSHGNLTVRHSTFAHNATQGLPLGSNGGGIYNAAGGTLTVSDSTFDDNSSISGGAIYNAGTATVTHSSLSNNFATLSTTGGTAGGGAIYNAAGATLTVLRSSFTNNAGRNGGGMENFGTAAVDHSTFTGNLTGTGLVGGGINNLGTLTVTACTFDGNRARVGGGGIANATGALLTVTASTLSNNVAVFGASSRGNGGGIYNQGTLVLTNSTLYGNTAADGGGLYNLGAATLTSVTVTANASMNSAGGPTMGGGLFVGSTGTLLLHNSIVAANFHGVGTAATADDIAGTVDSTSWYNLIGTGGSGGLVDGTNGNLVGVADVKLGPLAENGGPTKTVALLADSPAIDAGDPELLHTRDQRGVRRRHHVSIGAFQAN